jgi:hypothetical protein
MSTPNDLIRSTAKIKIEKLACKPVKRQNKKEIIARWCDLCDIK